MGDDTLHMGSRAFQFILPAQCQCCEKFLGEGENGICLDCLSKIHWIEPPFCSICGIPFLSKETKSHPCAVCLTRRNYFSMARAVGLYEGSLQQAIHRWKYQEKIYLTSFFGEWMVKRLIHYWDLSTINLLIPVPLHPQRLRERGFNQSLLLVKDINLRTGIPYGKRVLQKVRPTPPQVNLSGVEREKGVKGAFYIQNKEEIEGKSILLIDDVFTTGATVNECSKALLASGAKRVDVFTLAHALRSS